MSRQPPLPAQRRPLGRRLMLALFTLMMAPIAGWTVLGEFDSSALWSSLSPAEQAVLVGIQQSVRLKLALTLAASVLLFGAVVAYLRREVLGPLERLAEQARRATSEPWTPPPEVARLDETGDLARALDQSLTTLGRRAREAEQLARDLGHELRTPLATIRGATELLVDPDLSMDDRQRFARHAVAETERLERLVDELLDLARLDREPPAERTVLPLASVLGAFAERYRRWLETRGKRLEVTVEPSGLAALADRDRLERALVALIENAEAFSPPGGIVGVAARTEGERVTIAVTDEGPGVPADQCERIFDRFFTTARPVASPQGGTGLGLAIARRLVESTGGTLTAESRPTGGGRFVIRL